MAGRHNSVIRDWSAHAPPDVFSEDCRDAEHNVVAAVVAGHACRAGGFPVMATAGSGHLGITPSSAQQDGVLPDCQGQHDG